MGVSAVHLPDAAICCAHLKARRPFLAEPFFLAEAWNRSTEGRLAGCVWGKRLPSDVIGARARKVRSGFSASVPVYPHDGRRLTGSERTRRTRTTASHRRSNPREPFGRIEVSPGHRSLDAER